jgi:hypothetical protein
LTGSRVKSNGKRGCFRRGPRERLLLLFLPLRHFGRFMVRFVGQDIGAVFHDAAAIALVGGIGFESVAPAVVLLALPLSEAADAANAPNAIAETTIPAAKASSLKTLRCFLPLHICAVGEWTAFLSHSCSKIYFLYFVE